MKNSILSFFLINFFISYSQEVQLGSDLSLDNNIQGSDFVVDLNDEVYFSYLTSDAYLYVDHFDGVIWNSTVLNSAPLDSNVFEMTMIHDPLSDSVFIAYTKADGFYVRSFSGTWSSSSLYSCVPADPNFPEMQATLNEFDKEIHFLFETDDGPIDVEYLVYDINGGTFNLEGQPSFNSMGYNDHGFIYNPNDGFIYVSYFESGQGIVQLYNGSNWVNLDSEVIDEPTPLNFRSFLVRTDGPNDIILVYSYALISSNTFYYRGAFKYSCTNYSKTQILEEEYTTESIQIKEGTSNSDFFYVDCTPTTLEDNIAIIGPSPIYNSAAVPSQYNSENIYLSEAGYLYWTTYEYPHDLNLFKNGEFVLAQESINKVEYNQVYPNPANNEIRINSSDLFEVSFYSVDGSLVADGFEVSDSKPLNIDFLPKGSYIAKLKSSEGKIQQQRIVIE